MLKQTLAGRGVSSGKTFGSWMIHTKCLIPLRSSIESRKRSRSWIGIITDGRDIRMMSWDEGRTRKLFGSKMACFKELLKVDLRPARLRLFPGHRQPPPRHTKLSTRRRTRSADSIGLVRHQVRRFMIKIWMLFWPLFSIHTRRMWGNESFGLTIK